MKHVVYSDVKYCAGGPFFWTSICFRSDEEIDELIQALTSLKGAGAASHVHLQDEGLSPASNSECAEIVFYNPRLLLDPQHEMRMELDQREPAIVEARKILDSVR